MYTVVFRRYGTVNIEADTWLEAMEIAETITPNDVVWSDECHAESAYACTESDS